MRDAFMDAAGRTPLGRDVAAPLHGSPRRPVVRYVREGFPTTTTQRTSSRTGCPQLRRRRRLRPEGERRFAPGERFEYRNPGYEMLGLVIERVSGRTFGAFPKEAIFDLLGMQGSLAYEQADVVIPNRAFGYRKGEDGTFEVHDLDRFNWMMGAGGINSSLADLFRWNQALYGDALISGDQLARALSPPTLNDGSKSTYGFGWGLTGFHGHVHQGHGGG